MESFDVELRWPELFEHLSEREHHAVRQSLAAAWHEGFEPTRDHVKNLTEYARGVITRDEYRQRSIEIARHMAGVSSAAR